MINIFSICFSIWFQSESIFYILVGSYALLHSPFHLTLVEYEVFFSFDQTQAQINLLVVAAARPQHGLCNPTELHNRLSSCCADREHSSRLEVGLEGTPFPWNRSDPYNLYLVVVTSSTGNLQDGT
jgi:hypothetical protein